MSSEQAMRGALQAHLLTLGWGTDKTAFEGKTFTPVAADPYQEVTTEFFTPLGSTMAGAEWLQGVFQVRFMYPLAATAAAGIGPQTARAEAVKAGFPRTLRLVGAGGQLVKIGERRITRGPPQGDRDVTILRIRFRDR